MSHWEAEVGKRFNAYSIERREQTVYECTRYDPDRGLWMRDIFSGHETCVSERAIGRTFNEIRVSAGAEHYLFHLAEHGVPPDDDDDSFVPAIVKRLTNLGYINNQGKITERGQAFIANDKR